MEFGKGTSYYTFSSPSITNYRLWRSPTFGNLAARHGFMVRYQRTSRLLHALTLARADGSFTSLLRSIAKINLLIIDDWMRDPITLPNAQDILEVLDDRF